jgi:hypothetical protein
VSVWNNESDFYLTVDYELPEYDSAFVSQSKTLLVIALIVSLLVHWVILLFKPQSGLPIPITSSRSVDIRLIPPIPSVQKDVKENTIIEASPVIEAPSIIERFTNPIELPEPEKRIITSHLPDEKTQPISKPIEWLSAEDYQHISEAGDKKFDTDDVLAFNPGLKQNRSETRSGSKSGNPSSLENWQDTNGNRFYKVDGKCFMSLPQNIMSNEREGRNWYSVACGGKSDSENMIDNINSEMKARFKNP